MSPLISVVMGVYNGGKYLRKSVGSILNQTFTDFEFIIINDGSTDDTRGILESYQDDRIVLIHQENIGLTKTLNKGLALAKGKYFARQDADDISHPDRFTKQVAYLDIHEDCLVLGTWMEAIDEDGKVFDEILYPTEYDDIKNAIMSYDPIGHGTIMARADLLRSMGGYREKFYYAQDYDLWMRISEHGKLQNLNAMLYSLRYSPDCISVSKVYLQNEFASLVREDAVSRKEATTDSKYPSISIGKKIDQSPQSIMPEHVKTKILFVSHSSSLAGGEICLLTLIKGLNKARYDAVVVLPSEGPLSERLRQLGIKTYLIPIKRWINVADYYDNDASTLISRISSIIEVIETEKPDIVHTNTSVIWEGALATRFAGLPHIWHLHENLYGHPALKPSLPESLVYSYMDLLSDNIVAVSEYIRTITAQHIDNEKIELIYNGIEEPVIHASLSDQLRSELNIPSGGPLAVSVGSLSAEKGHDVLLTAACFAKEKEPDLRFIIIGPGTQERADAFTAKIDTLGLKDCVYYLGYRENALDIIACADFLVISSVTEAFSLVAVEAMALRIPVVTTDCGGPSEIVIHNETGYIVPVNDPLALCDKILSLCADKALRLRLGENGYRRYLDSFRAELYVTRFEELYTQVVKTDSVKIASNEVIANVMLQGYLQIVDLSHNGSLSDQQIKFLDAKNAELNQRLAERDQQIGELKRQVAEKDLQLAEKDLQLAGRDQLLVEINQNLIDKNQQLTERDHQLAEHDEQIEGLNNHLNGIINSLSWKITAPARAIVRLFIGRGK